MTTSVTRWGLLAAVGVLLIVAALLVSCAPDTTAPELQSRVAQAESADLSTPIAASAAEPATGAVRVAFTDQACLDCHTDKARLQALAVEPAQEAESLSSGPG